MSLRLFIPLITLLTLSVPVIATVTNQGTDLRTPGNLQPIPVNKSVRADRIAGKTHAIVVDVTFAYVGGDNDGSQLIVVDISNPDLSTVVGKTEPLGALMITRVPHDAVALRNLVRTTSPLHLPLSPDGLTMPFLKSDPQ